MTPRWVREHRRTVADEHRLIRADQVQQAVERVRITEQETARDWTPRRGMTFASEGDT